MPANLARWHGLCTGVFGRRGVVHSTPMAKRSAPAPEQISPEHRIVLIKGPDAFLRWLRTNELRAMLAKAHGSFDTFQFDGESCRIADVLDECRTFGLMAGHKLVIVDNADKMLKSAEDDEEEAAPAPAGARRSGPAIDTSPRGLMMRYALAPPGGATLVLRAGTWHKGKIDEQIQKVGAILTCDELKDEQAIAWAIQRAAGSHEATLAPEAARVLIERLGCDLGRIDGELGKLAIGVGKGGTITAAMVAQSVGHTREEEAWDLQRVLLTSDAPTILGQLRQVVDVSRQPTTLVTWACTDLARKLYGACAGLAAGANPFQIAGALRLWGESKDAILGAAQRTTPGIAARLLASCVETDARQKSGLGDPYRSLESLSLRFARVRGGGVGGRGGTK